ncbi:hypothetical protein Glove_444g16 [Diversispora epigaea]|uniref:Uncharacterized protein n=1 Tax=Diversispora epigaea TaxID=1348612 RepID=A0A397GRG9_9GLOM|nr:hypothetical protein Glove_444g16 [Diversispora epigaea]
MEKTESQEETYMLIRHLRHAIDLILITHRYFRITSSILKWRLLGKKIENPFIASCACLAKKRSEKFRLILERRSFEKQLLNTSTNLPILQYHPCDIIDVKTYKLSPQISPSERSRYADEVTKNLSRGARD